MSLNEELIQLRKRVKEQDKEIRRLKEENEFLEEASTFFAVRRRNFTRNKDCCLLLGKQKIVRLREKFCSIVKVWEFPDRNRIFMII